MYAAWVDQRKNCVEFLNEDGPDFNFQDWYQSYRWGLSNEHVVLDFFDKIIYLTVDTATLKQRIFNRIGNDFSKKPEEMGAIMLWRENNDINYRSISSNVIDASAPLEEAVSIVEEMLN